MTLESLLPILIPTFFAAYLVLERVLPGQAQPALKGWWTRGLIFFAIAFVLNGAVPAIVASLVGPQKGLGLSSLGTAGGAMAMLLLTDLIAYWVHRTMHMTPRLWLWTHQMHHSVERMDMLGVAYAHPFDFTLGTVLPGVIATLVLGITPEAAAWGGLFGFVLGVFPHANIHTPRWLGYVLQRPEMHAVHHTRDVHGYNYGNFAFSDLLFGTWRNPEGFPEAPYGFWDGASKQIGKMLLGRDVSRPV